jgi:hypothetical protein
MLPIELRRTFFQSPIVRDHNIQKTTEKQPIFNSAAARKQLAHTLLKRAAHA